MTTKKAFLAVIELQRDDVTADEVDFVLDRVFWSSPVFSTDLDTGKVQLVVDIDALDFADASAFLTSILRVAQVTDVSRVWLERAN